ncbi:MAG: hypothetical protein KY462_11555 [Actinobacteria bacterium]|nr:hypothetical protein [Actinomycetota bacterium]
MSGSLPPDVARWVAGPQGLAAVADATARLDRGEDPLQVGSDLRADGLSPTRGAAVMACADARRRARGVHRDADALLFTPDALEQASHPAVSAWRATRFRDVPFVADLCSGVGGDALAIARQGSVVAAVDRDEARLVLARHNATVRAVAVRPVVGDARRPPTRPGVVVHVDPSRRGPRGRARRLAAYDPPLDALQPVLAAARGYAVVLSPAVSLDDPDLPPGELEFIQVGAELVEAVVWGRLLRRNGQVATATLLRADAPPLTCSRDRDAEHLPVRPAGDWLVECAPAAVRARLHDALGAGFGGWRIARHRALLSVGQRPDRSPWWRTWAVEAELPLRARAVRAWLAAHGDVPVEIRTHGVDVDVERFWRDVGRPRRGPRGRTLHLVRLDTGARAYVCRRA